MSLSFVVISGLPGAGKSSLAEALHFHHDFEIVRGSTILQNHANKNAYTYDPTQRDGLMDYWQTVAKTRGNNWLAKCAISRAQETNVVFDGARILDDALTMKQHGGLLVYLELSEETMLRRILARQRTDDSNLTNAEDISRRIQTELDGDHFKLAAIKSISDLIIPETPEAPQHVNRYADLAATIVATLGQ